MNKPQKRKAAAGQFLQYCEIIITEEGNLQIAPFTNSSLSLLKKIIPAEQIKKKESIYCG